MLRIKFLEDLKNEALQSEFDGALRKLTEKEKEAYDTLHADLQLLFDESRKEMFLEQSPMVEPVDIYLVCGNRGKEAQTQAYASGFTKVFWPFSPHNKTPSDGLDTAPYVKGKGIDWDNLSLFRYMNNVMMRVADRLYSEGRISKIRFGADFNMDGDLKNDRFVDLPHCERRPDMNDTKV